MNSGAALATVVGVLVEVPVMLSVVAHRHAQPGLVRAGGGRADVTVDVRLAVPDRSPTQIRHETRTAGNRQVAVVGGGQPGLANRLRNP